MTAGAVKRGALGVIIGGRCRDLAEHRSANFPVFARGHSTLGQSPFTRASEVQIPITVLNGKGPEIDDAFPSVTVVPGDWIVADLDGVVCIPRELKDQVVNVAEKGREVDARCLIDIQAGRGVQETFAKWRGK